MTSFSPPSDPLDLERDLPVTAEDLTALRRHRQGRHDSLLHRLDLLAWPAWLPPPQNRRPTHRGLDPFDL